MRHFRLLFCCLHLLAASVWADAGFAADTPQTIQEFEDRTWRVTGTVTDDMSGQEIIIVEHFDTGRSLTLRIGDQLADGFTLAQATSNSILFRKGDDHRSFEISRGIGAVPPATPAKVEQNPTPPSDGLTDPGMKRISVSLRKVKEILNNSQAFANQVGLESVTGADGTKSLRIAVTPDTQLLEAYGLSDGDILLAVNGDRVTMAQELLAIVQDAEPGKSVPIAFQRAGEIRQISYQIDE